MSDEPVELDQHRGMAAQKATDIRRIVSEVEANQKDLRVRQEELEAQLTAAPASNWIEASDKARYILNLYAVSIGAHDTRRHRLITSVIDDFNRLAASEDIDQR